MTREAQQPPAWLSILELEACATIPHFYMGVENPSSDPNAYIPNILSTERAP